MELSERERRLLQEMESRLLAEDPSLASSLSVHRLRVGLQAMLAVAGLVIGVLLMSVGIWRAHLLGIAIALIGFLVVLAATNVAVDCLQVRRSRRPRTPKATRKARPRS
jgi:uncharacterized membrane protein